MTFLKTPAAAADLHVPYYVLIGLLRYGKITPPAKDSSGDYVWAPDDIKRAHEALAGRARRVRSAGAAGAPNGMPSVGQARAK